MWGGGVKLELSVVIKVAEEVVIIVIGQYDAGWDS